ncbi:fucoxanthin chlorophyll a/c protein, LI818 clade [Chaetoceros tenuissimus]|uniref:Fucoxanthin chlorophyll a/c protein, LI818 clade n=1 Tax=Chaetoceros tenuissimus TaxID=426638 RepID=A0AAD3HB85_9STRA|nr:fucoxanthin chlorophyll a/c protein, LI818 clade [Chaetoceros tenuissimus]
MKLAIFSTLIAASSAFAPSTSIKSTSALRSTESIEEPEAAPVASLNGWTPDAYENCYGLPGAIAPTGFFDPLGFARRGISLTEVKRNREAEVMHGRVAMLASVGYLAGEAVSGPFHTVGPANDQLAQIPLPAFALLTVIIATAELKRARTGWVEPDFGSWEKTLWTLRDSYYPGDLGFDPLGLKPTDAKAFANMQTRELQNGRLAMLGVAGMCSQELVNHRGIFETFDFYSKVYSGVNPYATCGDAIIC